MEFEITRDKIPLTSVDLGYMITDDIGYIKISNFSKTTHDEFLDAVSRLKEQGMQKIILDLRENGGGFMNAATEIADHFLSAGKLIVYTEGYAQPRKDILATNRGELLDNEVVLLIDERSASASEILAGALQDNDRGLIFGRRSFGKGLVQQQTMFTDGSALRLTVARYYTPLGRSIQKPYENGLDEYYHELRERLSRGEYFYADSIKFADSLKYVTPGGNIVYGGGGIMPDIFIPIDTSLNTPYIDGIVSRGLDYRFAFQYADKNRQTLSQFSDYRELSAYLNTQSILAEFVRFAEDNGVIAESEDIILSQHVLLVSIKAHIGRHILDNMGFYPIIHEIDPEVIKSIEILAQS
jgi:carboxyl-terminal processing protease